MKHHAKESGEQSAGGGNTTEKGTRDPKEGLKLGAAGAFLCFCFDLGFHSMVRAACLAGALRFLVVADFFWGVACSTAHVSLLQHA
jgi:hypothetical protein